MKLVKVIALKDHEWAKVAHYEGDTYIADSEDIRYDALLAIGFARYVGPVEDVRPKEPSRYNRRDLQAKK